jgi:hypothetical protein
MFRGNVIRGNIVRGNVVRGTYVRGNVVRGTYVRGNFVREIGTVPGNDELMHKCPKSLIV